MSQYPFSMPDLTASILARTSGPACGRLRALACDLADGTLARSDRDLAERHLEHCQACRALLVSLGEATQILPSFAQVPPGEAFTASVLAQTRPRRLVQPPDRLVEGWLRFIRRPRAALESAYLATAAGLILTQIPLPGPMNRTSGALVAQVLTESRAHLVGSAPLPPTWTTRVLHSSPARFFNPPRTIWRSLWFRVADGFGRAWSACSRAPRHLLERLGIHTTVPSRTEPSASSGRPAS
jgi:hypothetical protein